MSAYDDSVPKSANGDNCKSQRSVTRRNRQGPVQTAGTSTRSPFCDQVATAGHFRPGTTLVSWHRREHAGNSEDAATGLLQDDLSAGYPWCPQNESCSSE